MLPPLPPEMWLFIFNEKHDPGAIPGLGLGKQGKMVSMGLAGGGGMCLCRCHRLRGAASSPRWDPRLRYPCGSLRGWAQTFSALIPWEARRGLILVRLFIVFYRCWISAELGEEFFWQLTGSMSGENKVQCAQTAPSLGNPITLCVTEGFNVEYLLLEHQMLVVKPGHGQGHVWSAQGGAGVFGVPIDPHGWVVEGDTAAGHVSPLGLQIRGERWYLLAHFLYQNQSTRIKRERQEGSGLGALTPPRLPGACKTSSAPHISPPHLPEQT